MLLWLALLLTENGGAAEGEPIGPTPDVTGTNDRRRMAMFVQRGASTLGRRGGI
jgi:hypothetical protein